MSQLLDGKTGLVMGVANKRSIAWAIANAANKAGARLILTYQNDRLGENVRELAPELNNPLVLPCDVASESSRTTTLWVLPRRLSKLQSAIWPMISVRMGFA